ncbi:MAG: (2Fe-2S)-binding protein [Anaerolineae bacterium]|nr:(2Fe-2S)-binding protein [Anaerolineae bacterium]
MTDTVTLTIDGNQVTVPAGTTLLDAAAQIGITIPTTCYHPTLTANGLCRVCSVEVEGARTLVSSCVAKVAEGMVVHTESERVRRSRRTILEMLASAVDVSEAPEIVAQMQQYGVDAGRFAGTERREIPLLDDNPFYIRDYAKCILCWRCVQVCAEDVQHTFALNLSGRGFETTIGTF